jgi:hypothetical protein
MATGRVPTTANSPLTAKGDLFTYSTAPARLAVGLDGEQIVANSAASSGLQYNANFSAGKNKVINGDFGIWQRGTTATPALNNYGFGPDRFMTYSFGSSTSTISQQTFTPGTAPVAGYEGQYFVRLASTNTQTFMEARLEDVRTLAGQSATLSFWAKTASAQTTTASVYQNFGTGGSSSVFVGSANQAVTTSWTRFTYSFTMPSITGKTIGTGGHIILNWTGAINNNLDIWGVQLEAGSVATAFNTATGTLQGELAACQRYYIRNVTGGNSGAQFSQGNAASTTLVLYPIPLPVTMRINPNAIDYNGTTVYDIGTGASTAISALTINQATPQFVLLLATVASGLTQYRPYNLYANTSAAAYIGLSAEL